LGAIEDQSLEAKLKFIAPKGNEEQGAVQFIIEADLFLNDSIFIRAGYSANASLVLRKKIVSWPFQNLCCSLIEKQKNLM